MDSANAYTFGGTRLDSWFHQKKTSKPFLPRLEVRKLPKLKTLTSIVTTDRENKSSRPEVFCTKGVLKNFKKFLGIHLCRKLIFNKGTLKKFAIFTEIHLCQSLFSNKVTGWIPATLLKRDFGMVVFL